MSQTHVDRALSYCLAAAKGKISVCRWVKLAAERQLRDLARQHDDDEFIYTYSHERAERICKFISMLCHVKGEYAGKKIYLEDWQCFLLCTAFGWIDPKGRRRFRTVHVELARKGGKSSLAAGIGLYMAFADGEAGAEVYSSATTRDQAKIVFSVAQQMARRDRAMRDFFGIKVGMHALSQITTGSTFQALSAEGSTLDGLNVHCGIIDELHAHKSRSVFDVIDTATGSRSQPMIFVITTAGHDQSGVCFEQRTYLTRILEQQAVDERFFGLIYTLDKGDQWDDPSVWYKANPNLDISVTLDDLQAQFAKAKELPAARTAFRTKRLNQWLTAAEEWLPAEFWAQCHRPNMKLSDFHGWPCYAGLDLAHSTDVAALMLLFCKDGEYACFGKYFLPEATVVDRADTDYGHYLGWSEQGFVDLTPGNATDYRRIEEAIVDAHNTFSILEVAYDPWQATEMAIRLGEQYVDAIEVPANVGNYSAPMKRIESLVAEGKLYHNDPVLTWMISNVEVFRDHKDNIYPRKASLTRKIDGVVALISALNRAMAAETTGESMYNSERLLTIGGRK